MDSESFSATVRAEVCQLRAKSPSRRYFLTGLLCSQAAADSREMPVTVRIHGDNPGKIESYFAEEGYITTFDGQNIAISRKGSSSETTLLEDMVTIILLNYGVIKILKIINI